MTPDEDLEAYMAAFGFAEDVVAQVYTPPEAEEEIDIRAALEAWFVRESQRPPHPEDCSCGACWSEEFYEAKSLEALQARYGWLWQGPIEEGW